MLKNIILISDRLPYHHTFVRHIIISPWVCGRAAGGCRPAMATIIQNQNKDTQNLYTHNTSPKLQKYAVVLTETNGVPHSGCC